MVDPLVEHDQILNAGDFSLGEDAYIGSPILTMNLEDFEETILVMFLISSIIKLPYCQSTIGIVVTEYIMN